MTDKLTNIEICELLGWDRVGLYSFTSSPGGTGWLRVGHKNAISAPHFDELEQPWFEFVVPYLNKKGFIPEIKLYIGEVYVWIATGAAATDDSPHIAFNKALYQLKEQL